MTFALGLILGACFGASLGVVVLALLRAGEPSEFHGEHYDGRN